MKRFWRKIVLCKCKILRTRTRYFFFFLVTDMRTWRALRYIACLHIFLLHNFFFLKKKAEKSYVSLLIDPPRLYASISSKLAIYQNLVCSVSFLLAHTHARARAHTHTHTHTHKQFLFISLFLLLQKVWWVGCVHWHINFYRLFNAKSYLCVY